MPRQQPVAADASKEQKEPEVLGFRAWFRALALGFKSVLHCGLIKALGSGAYL